MAIPIRSSAWWASVVGAVAIFGLPGVVCARAQADLQYPWSQIWQTAVRLIRVDLHCPITDRDEAIGYVLFDYVDGSRRHPGSLELVRSSSTDGSGRVRVIVQVPAMPSWVERMILDRLMRKLRDEFGDPPRAAGPGRTDREGVEVRPPPHEREEVEP